ncbi:arginine-tRNA-protein transferase 1 [Sporormia fimetaria CBS 119925]|uniref:Arginyl-tRNA--protein transferase 1 n=1 Tax=Sporormia fimetaria CBS 119925 TaxID=1340428 RepID=A0A6A6VF15_9PLEO|nr:arginine-tRNA-protein transferase 1 [Sporormia fimetaria CBS 119925]
MQSLVTPLEASYYLIAKSLSVDDYARLVDRGFRRSGTLLYKPDVVRQCCPHYTIRLPVALFRPGRDHRQAVHRWNKYVLGEGYVKEAARRYPISKEEKSRLRNAFDLVNTVHESEYSHVKRPPEPAHKFEVTLEPDNYTDEKFELYKNYQHHVHHESLSEISPPSFRRFLCDSPLERTTRLVDGYRRKYGSFHQCYRLDGRLIAMGVLDLLPHAVSGVYLMYHPDFEKWSFGKLSALREAALALEHGYGYYYMGFYIHSCPKMRYKATYMPQQILDPESNEWNPFDDKMTRLLDTKPFVSLSREGRREFNESIGSSKEDSREPTADDELEDYPLRAPRDAAAAVSDGMSLFDLKIPGIMTAEEVVQGGALDNLMLHITQFGDVPFKRLTASLEGDVKDPRSLKGELAAFVACVGPEVARSVRVRIG